MSQDIRVTVWNEFRHETYPIYTNEQIPRVLYNAVRWVRQRVDRPDSCPQVEPLEAL